MTVNNPNRPPPRAADDGLDAIPMKKSNPLLLGAIIGAVVLVIAVVALSTRGKKSGSDKTPAAAVSAEQDPLANMTPEERRRHLEITRKSLEKVAEKEAADEAKKKAEEAAKAEEASKTAAASPGGAPVSGNAPAAPDEPAKPKAPTKTQKKQADDLDKLGSDIAGQLGK